MSFLDDLPDPPVEVEVVTPPEVPKRRNADEDRLALFKQLEDEILQESAAIVRGALDFYRLGEEHADGPPPEWIDELGEEAAWDKFRIVLAANQSAAKAPVGLKLAQQTMLGIIRARATEKAAPRSLNVAYVYVNQAPPADDMPPLEITDGDEE